MSDKKDKNSPKQDKKNNLSSYWFYAILIVLLVGVNMVMGFVSKPEEISMLKFEKIALAGDIKKVEVVNKTKANIYVTKESISKYKEDFEDENSISNSLSIATPQFTMTLGSVEHFQDRVQALNEKGAGIDPMYSDKVNWIGTILSWTLPLLLFVGLWLFIMRRVSGGTGGPGAQIFNIGKSKATLFDATSNVPITFADVAGLDEAKEEVMEIVDFLKNPTRDR